MRKSVLSILIPLLSGFSAFAASGPLLVPDYDRDGKIDVADYDRLAAGEAFTVWLNDDDDAAGAEADDGKGDTNTDLHDVPGGEGNDKDCEDDKVNGRCDLLDFFPVLIDVIGVEGSGDYTWKLVSTSVNVVFTQLQTGNAGDFHTKEAKALDDDTPLYEAAVERLAGDEGKKEVALPDDFLKEGRGVIIVEGAAIGDKGLTLRGTKAGSDPVEVTLKLNVKNVEDMYGWMNLRPEENKAKNEDEGEQWKVENSSVRLSPSPSPNDSRHFILVHGYNTNHEEARGNAAEFYKKLYQSGSDAMMTAVEWRGDQSWVEFFGHKVTPNYHVNVENAFAAARPFADTCKKLPGEKILVAHSLGNVLVSSAIKDYGLDYTKYVMLNAAVPREAFDASAYDVDMVPVDWKDEVEKVGGGGDGGGEVLTNHLDRASRWYRNFADRRYDPYEYRRKLAWRGRFANLPRTVNYYSPTDNILVNPDPNEPDPDARFMRDDGVWRNVQKLLEEKLVDGRSIGRGGSKKTGYGFWSFSEKMKGTWLLDVVNDVLTNMLEVAQADAYKCEGGWGTNANYNAEATEFDPANTRFTPFLDERLKAQGMLDILPAETERVRAQHLADAIPAESFAAGANPVATVENVNEESFIGENPDWPLYEGEEIGEARTNLWNHSAFREVAFYHTSKFYTSLAAIGKPRVIIDTDLGSSMDDLWTIDFAARMHKAGKLDLMAVMMDRPDNSDEEGRGEFLKFADRYLASLGFANLPLGKSLNLAEDRLPQHVFNPYWTLIYSNDVSGASMLMPTNRTDVELASLTNAVALYRRLLNESPDKSVVICSIGFLNNLKALMESGIDHEGDGIDSTGIKLIAAKVKELRIMGGCFDQSSAPDGTGGAEYNLAGDPVASKKVLEEWPTPVVMSPWEVGLNLDYKADDVLADFPVGTPDPVIRAAYEYWPKPAGEGEMNRPWDLATILPLTEGDTLIPLSGKGGIAVDDKGVTTFTPNASSNRCYQLASSMSTNAVLARFRAVFRTGNPSVKLLVSGKPEPGVDYNGSELVFKFENIQLGGFSEGDIKFGFTVDGAEYSPESTEWDETLGVLSVRFAIPSDAVTAGNVYNGTLAVSLENENLGSVQLTSASRQLVQGAIDRDVPTGWFSEYDLTVPTNYVPETQMPERTTAIVDTTFLFESPSPDDDEPPPDGVQAAVRVVEDGDGGYKFQYYAFVGNEDGFYYRGWHDFNVGGENVRELKPVVGQNYVVRMEGFYYEDARGEENTVVFSVAQEGSNEGFMKQFVGNLINENGGLGGRTRLNSVEFAGEGTVDSLVGDYCRNLVNSNLARIDGDDEYATVADAVGAASGDPIRLLYAASWSPSMSDLGKSVRFLNKSLLHLDISGLPANARAVWTDVDGNNGTLTLELVYADTVVYGTIRTAEGTDYVEGAIAVADGKYVYVGDEDGVAEFVKDGVTKIIDHRNKGMVMPGCTDGHSHYTMKFGMDNMKGSVMFALEDDKTAVLQKVAAAVREAEEAGKTSLFGFGWNFLALMQDPVSLKDLDDVTHGVSTIIFDQGGHHAFCNSECLRRCGIIDGEGKVIKEIAGGYLGRDEDGYATGYADERVTGYLMRMGGINYDELLDDKVAEASIGATRDLLLSTGYTIALDGWSNMLHSNKLYEAAKRMDTNGTLRLVFPMTYEVEPWQTDMNEQIDCLASLDEKYGTAHVLPKYLKLFMDGVVETKTGAMLKPYKDDGSTYDGFWSVDRLADITRECNAKGLTVHVHTMGDAAIRDTVEAFIRGGDRAHRNCLVHLRNVSTNEVDDFERIAENNIACSAGFTWHVGNGEEADAQFAEFLDEDYIKHAYPMKSFFDAGIRVSSHSDFPANIPCPQDPFGIMEVAVTGQRPDLPADKKLPAYDPNELVSVEQAFQALTLNGAWQLGLENERGSIKVGKWADFVLADQDVFECAVTDIAKTKVVSTWFEGEKVYEAPSTVQVTPGEPVVFETAEAATNGMKAAVITPSEEVAEMFGADAEAKSAYCAMFELYVGATTDGKWAVGAFLKPGPWTNVVESAQDATLQLPVQRIAEWETGDEPILALLTNCVPGFYYSLFDGATLTNITPTMSDANLNVLCGTDGEVVLPKVMKPIGGQDSGFFTIGVQETSDIEPGSEGKVPVPPVPHPGPQPYVH